MLHIVIKIEGLTLHGFISEEAVKFDHLFFWLIDLSESSFVYRFTVELLFLLNMHAIFANGH